MIRFSDLYAALLVLLMILNPVAADDGENPPQQIATETETINLQRGQFGVGFQASFPAYGISGLYDINREISIQAIFGFFGNLQTYAGRGQYRFAGDDAWNAYGYGMLGIWRYSFRFLGATSSESALGFGVGAGIEYDWRIWYPDFPPIVWNIEFGIGHAGLDHYSFSSFMFGAGFHYRF
jgi:hypothetical protein